jgi:hypothetical protein
MTETPQTAPLLHDPDGPAASTGGPRAAGPVGAAGGRRPGDLVPGSDEASHVSGANIPVDGGAAVVG